MTPKASKRVRQGIDRYPKHHERLREYRCCHPALLDKLCGNARRGESESRATFRFRINTQASGDFSKQLHLFVNGEDDSGSSVGIIGCDVVVYILEPDFGLARPVYFCQVFIRRSISASGIVRRSSETLSP